jgi:hypothetical protein
MYGWNMQLTWTKCVLIWIKYMVPFGWIYHTSVRRSVCPPWSPDWLLGPTCILFQTYLPFFPRWLSGRGVKLMTAPSGELKNVWSCTSIPQCLCGMQGDGSSLPFSPLLCSKMRRRLVWCADVSSVAQTAELVTTCSFCLIGFPVWCRPTCKFQNEK